MKVMIKLEKEDIRTCKFGLNYTIEAQGVSIVFSPEALDEFINDVKGIKEKDVEVSG